MIETLLIIEDEKLLGSELSRHYRQMGWDVLLAKNLAEAKALLLEKRIEPSVILSDMNLPDGNALDFMEAMKKQVSYAEWLFLTGYGSVPDSVRALRLGAYDFLEKPCDLGASRPGRRQCHPQCVYPTSCNRSNQTRLSTLHAGSLCGT